MKTRYKFSSAALFIGSLVAAPSASAAIYSFADFTAAANGPQTETSTNFQDAWTTAAGNNINGEDSLYLTATVSWTSNADIGTFAVRLACLDDGVKGRYGFQPQGSSFQMTDYKQTPLDPDGSGPATDRPTIPAFDTVVNTSVTLVLKVDQMLSRATPGGDWWFADEGKQSDAGVFMWINPNLAADEAFTPIAMWRSGGDVGYQSLAFMTDTAGTALTFSNIKLYTGTDTPFNAVPKPALTAITGPPIAPTPTPTPTPEPEPESVLSPILGLGGITVISPAKK